MIWRSHLAEDCPPDDAIPTTGLAYRLAERANFDERDFLSKREEYPNKQWDVPECIACGISMFTKLEGVQQLLRRIPGKKRKRKKVIVGNLRPQHGKMKNTPSNTHESHHTWWIPLGEEPWKIFEIIQLPEDS